MPAGVSEKVLKKQWSRGHPGEGWEPTGRTRKHPKAGPGSVEYEEHEYQKTIIQEIPGATETEEAGPVMGGQPVEQVQKEYAPLQGEFRGALQSLVSDPTQARQQAQYRLGRQVGAQAAQLQRAATRGGAAGRGGGTGVVTAPAAEMAARGQQELETGMYDRQVQNMAALGQALQQGVQAALSVRGFDQQTQANAIHILQNALGLIGDRLEDPDIHLVVSQAYNRYKKDIADGVNPVQAAMTFSITLQSGTTEQQTATA